MYTDLSVYVVYSILIFDISGSVPLSGAVFGFFILPSLIAPIFGNIIDSVRSGPLVMWSNIIVAMLTVPLLFSGDYASIWFVYLSAATHGLSYTIYSSAKASIVMNNYDYDDVGPINAKMNTTREINRIAAPMIGAFIYSWFGASFFIITHIALLIVSGCFFLKIPIQAKTHQPTDPMSFNGIMDGAAHILTNKTLKIFLIVICVNLLISGFYEVSLIKFIDDIGEKSSLLGTLMTIQGVGALIGSIVCIKLKTDKSVGLVSVGMLIQTVGMLALGAEEIIVIYASSLTFGFGAPMILIGMDTTTQTLTPRDLQGRVCATISSITCVPLSVSFLIAGTMIDIIGRNHVSIIMLMVGLVCSAIIGILNNNTHFRKDGKAKCLR